MDCPTEITIHFDGASRGNPGPAAAGFVLTDSRGATVQARAFFLGEATSSVAEYTALIKALQAAQEIGARQLKIYGDSEFLVRQVLGRYRVRTEHILPLYDQVMQLLAGFRAWTITHVPRARNQAADRLVNRALDLGRDIEDGTVGAVANKKIRLGILISGGGRTMMNILDCIRQGRLNAEIAVVISSRSTVAGVEKAIDAGLPVQIIRTKDYPDVDEFSGRIEAELVAASVELVLQGGWLCLWKIPPRYENRVMNIHPALLPSFGGRGMWGHHVHEAVLAAGCKISGCTVHFCTNEYDKGPIIVQRTCCIREDDTPDTLAERVFGEECIAYPEAIRLFADGCLSVEAGKVKVQRLAQAAAGACS